MTDNDFDNIHDLRVVDGKVVLYNGMDEHYKEVFHTPDDVINFISHLKQKALEAFGVDAKNK